MQFGNNWIPVELLDESAGGFGVRVEQMPEVEIGDKVRLFCGPKCFEVEVMHVTQCPHADDSHHETAGEPSCKLGVRRISEVFQPTHTRTSFLQQIMGKRYRPPFSLDGKGIGLGLTIAFLVGVLPAVTMVSFGPNFSDIKSSSSAKNDKGFIFGSGSSSPKTAKMKIGSDAGSYISASGEGVHSSKLSSLSKQQQGVWQSLLERAKLQVDIEPWTDAMLALLANLVHQMGLNDLQQVESTQLLKYTEQSLENLNTSDSGENQEEVEQKRLSILEEAYTSLIHLFNETQQDEWNKLVEQQDEKPEKK